jgi:adenosine deaminase
LPQILLCSAGALALTAGPALADADGAAARLDRIRGDHARVLQFLQEMPKGGDLHMHLSGAIYAEALVSYGAADGICLNTVTLASSYPPCGANQVPLSTVPTNTTLYNRVVSAWSMRGFTPSVESGHDHFFATFDLFGATLGGTRSGDGLAQVTARAQDQAEQYVEPMFGAAFGANRKVATEVGYSSDFAGMRQKMIDAGLFDAMPGASAYAQSLLDRRAALQNCGTPKAQDACDVAVRFDAQILRNQPPEVVFAQLAFAFELLKRDANFVGLNMVQQEDGVYSLRDYRLHMRMIQYLRTLYPGTKVTLHAGELWPGVAPPQDLRFHIRAAVNTAAAQRIGHGVDLRWERHPNALMDTMVKAGTCVEINLTSNRQILGVSGKKHPIRDYWDNGVRIVLSTDEEGVSRTDLTHQYQQAVDDHGFGYRDLKTMAKNALRCSFLPKAQKQRALAKQRTMFKTFEANYN